jgi:hypothetical protein
LRNTIDIDFVRRIGIGTRVSETRNLVRADIYYSTTVQSSIKIDGGSEVERTIFIHSDVTRTISFDAEA